MIDFSRIKGPHDFPVLDEIAAEVDWRDLPALTTELYDALAAQLAKVNDAAMGVRQNDPSLSDDEEGWTIPHIIAHLTATQEESAAQAAQLARGIEVEGRSRFEVPWEELETLRQVQDRLQESRRICLAYLQAWPDEPHFEVTFVPFPGSIPLTALTRYLLGLFHTDTHMRHLRDTVEQVNI